MLNKSKAANAINSKPVNAPLIDVKHRWLLLFSQFIVLISLAPELVAWMNAIIGLCLVWQGAIVANVLSRPNKYLVFLIALTGAVVIAISGKQLGLLLSMIHLICYAYTIKSLELNTRKDLLQVILLGLFLLACAFIFRQSVWFAFSILTFTIVNFSVLYLYFAPKVSVYNALKKNGTMLLISAPLALTMFVLFPRLQPFWQMPISKSAKTGLGDQVKPGDIASLARSSELAFRVKFTSDIPSNAQMYWRAMTLPYYDGQGWQLKFERDSKTNWRMIQEYSQRLNLSVDTSGPAFQYQVIAEPSFQHWLFGLDVAQTKNEDLFQVSDYSIRSSKPISKTIAYDVKSYSSSALEPNLSERRKQLFLTLPADSNPKLQEYAHQLTAKHTNAQAIISDVLNTFSQQQFYYTLQPPLLDNNSLEQFFFDTKSGFCEHYASTFSFIMRAAGIPSRVVTGYMGAKYNPQGEYYSIYQYDAHAWSEVWLEGQGWVRVDPTAAVSPERVSLGMSLAMAEEQSALENEFFSMRNFSQVAIFSQLKLQLEAIDYQWTRLVVGYTMEKQSKLLKELLGNGKLWKSALLFLVALAAIFFCVWLFNVRPVRTQLKEQWQRDFERFLRILDKRGFKRSSGQTVKQYMQSLEQSIAHKEGKLTCLWLSYYKLSYQNLTAEDQVKESSQFNRHLRESLKLIATVKS